MLLPLLVVGPGVGVATFRSVLFVALSPAVAVHCGTYETGGRGREGEGWVGRRSFTRERGSDARLAQGASPTT